MRKGNCLRHFPGFQPGRCSQYLSDLDLIGLVWFGFILFSPVWFWSHGLNYSWEGRILYKHWSWAHVYRDIIARMQMLTGAPCFEIPKNQLLTLCDVLGVCNECC